MKNKKTGLYVKNLRYPDSPDVSQLAPFYFEIDDSKPLLKKTLKSLKEHLWFTDIGGFRRFRRFEICRDWHWYTGGSGSWIAMTCWAAKFYHQLGDEENYKECMGFN